MAKAKVNERGVLLAEQYGCWIAKRCWKNRQLFCVDDCAMVVVDTWHKRIRLHCCDVPVDYDIVELHVKETGTVREE